MAISPFMPLNPPSPTKPKVGDTFFNSNTAQLLIWDGSQWVVAHAGMGTQGLLGPQGLQGIAISGANPLTIGANGNLTLSARPRPEWEPFFAVWPKRTISGKIRMGRIMKRTQRYVEYTDFASAERITITQYATKKEAFAWKLKHHG